ncbi:Chromosome partitioning ATPase, Mrp family, contains Fe-S cluster [Mameliella alba]|uniref:CpsD/CapB family tyrosine-protein kinase n=1 Tax=Mameliella alba TaxID=561184 RepID=UPI00088ACD59|nr:CpsD/CapB family tyrosine-protein kinase [Mameliella alba]PTR39628.1 Mrp family chromosome partitioning ATPase [Mameliella alba]SDD17574.1 Chromosome partitioning ATPase, Mrp family, contains Fe-S cluster [Mameliella alba]
MNMMDSPKFRRKRTSATGSARPVSEPPDPVRPLDETAREAARKRDAAAEQARSEAEAHRIAEAADKAKAREKAQEKLRRRAELEELARAEALRRVMAARARREAEAREAAERAEAEAALQAEKQAEERRIEAERADEERAAEARRKAAEEKAEAERLAEEEKRAEQVRLAEARTAEDAARRAEEERLARERAEATETVPPLALTGMVPVTEQPASTPASARAPQEPDPVDSAWARLSEMTVDKGHLDRNRIITASRDDPAHAAFDVLRTRLLQALHENGWRRVAITSPGKECGKTFTAANLAISLSRQENCRTLLLDLDMRRPSLHRILGVSDPGSLGDMLRGMTAPGDHLLRMGRNPVNAGRNIAFGLNGRPEAYASELLQDPRAESCLQRIEDEFDPDVVLIDLPPALSYDDVIAARPLFDGVLLVIGGGMTTEKEIAEVERRLGDGTPILGMILNKAEGTELDRYSY